MLTKKIARYFEMMFPHYKQSRTSGASKAVITCLSVALFFVSTIAYGESIVGGVGTGTLTITKDITTVRTCWFTATSTANNFPRVNCSATVGTFTPVPSPISGNYYKFVDTDNTSTTCNNYTNCMATGTSNYIGNADGYFYNGTVWSEVSDEPETLLQTFSYVTDSAELGCPNTVGGDCNGTAGNFNPSASYNQVFNIAQGEINSLNWSVQFLGGYAPTTLELQDPDFDTYSGIIGESLGYLDTVAECTDSSCFTYENIYNTLIYYEESDTNFGNGTEVDIGKMCIGLTECFSIFMSREYGTQILQFELISGSWEMTSEITIPPEEIPDPENPFGTHIVSLLQDNETIATSTSAFNLGGEIYISESDYNEGLYFKISYRRQSTSLGTGASYEEQNLLGEWTQEWDITGFGTTTYSIEVENPDNIGVYILTGKIYDRDWFFDDQLAVKVGRFIIGEKNAYDKAIEQQLEGLENPNAFDIQEECSITALSACMKGIIVWATLPSPESIDRFKNLFDDAKTLFPLSYAYDVVVLRNELFNSSSSSDIEVTVSIREWEFTFISREQLEDIPLSATVKIIIGALLWFMAVNYIYFRVLRMHDNNTVA